MKFSRSYLGVLGASLAGWPTAYALQWTTVEAVLRPLADGAMPVASYSFRNATAAPVTITQAVATCDCTLIDLAKKTYASGESVPSRSGLAVFCYFLVELIGESGRGRKHGARNADRHSNKIPPLI